MRWGPKQNSPYNNNVLTKLTKQLGMLNSFFSQIRTSVVNIQIRFELCLCIIPTVAANKLCTLFPAASCSTTQVARDLPACQPCSSSRKAVASASLCGCSFLTWWPWDQCFAGESGDVALAASVSSCTVQQTDVSVAKLWAKVHHSTDVRPNESACSTDVAGVELPPRVLSQAMHPIYCILGPVASECSGQQWSNKPCLTNYMPTALHFLGQSKMETNIIQKLPFWIRSSKIQPLFNIPEGKSLNYSVY